jgi:ABC-type antimicrobial peptide transport system permease subunit
VTRFLLRRLALIPFALLGANFVGFAYAHFAFDLQMRRNPFFAPVERPAPVWSSYAAYLQQAIGFDFGSLPIGSGLPIGEAVWNAVTASLGLLAVTFLSAPAG